MTMTDMPDMQNCPLPAALDAIGERWSFLILRGAMVGLRHFEDFQSSLGIARNILSNRLTRLVEKGILSRHHMQCDKRKIEYRLTEKGAALTPVVIALRQWGEKWESCGEPCNPVLIDKRDGKPIQGVAILADDGRALDVVDLTWHVR
jgi:DNA-binding HxlR family transcriptional regulator